jgi:tetratricopeptide (TPR) repeat protein
MNERGPEWPPPTPGLTNFLDIAEARDAKWFAKRYWKWIAASGVLCAILGVGWVYFFPPQYVSKATVRFLPPQVAGRFVNPNFSMEVGQRMFALSQLLGSRLTAGRMIEAYSLYPERRRFQTVEDLTKKFSGDLQVVQVGNAAADDRRAVPTLQISFAYPDAEKSQKVVQKLVEQVYEENSKYRGDQSLGTTEFLEEQLNAAEERVLETEQRLGEIQDAIGLTVSQTKLGQNTSRSYVIDSRLRDLRHDRRQQEERKSTKKAEWEQLELLHRRIETRPVEFYIPEYEGMQHYWHLRDKVSAAKTRLERLKERFNPSMPDVVSAENDVRETELEVERFHKERGVRLRNRDLEANAAKIALAKLELQALDKEAIEQMKEESELRTEAQKLREQQGSPAGQEVELLVAKREYDSAKEQHGQLFKKHEESRAASEMERRGQGESVEMLEPASLPGEAERPTWSMRIAIAGALGLTLSTIWCLFLALRDPKVLHESHVENWSGLPVLANFAAAVGVSKGVSRKASAVASCLVFLLLSGCGRWNESAADMTLKGQQEEREGRPAVALLLYRQAIRKDAKFGAAFEGIARLALKSGELEAARDALARAVELSPGKQLLLKQLAQTSYQIYFDDPGRPTALLREVEALAERLKKQWPATPDGYRILAQVLMERHRTDEAIQLLETSSSHVKNNESLRAQMAAALYRTGRPEKAQEVLESLIEENPSYLDAFDLLYLQLMQRKQSAMAREVLEQKWKQSGDIEAGMQLAAHDDAHGDRAGATKLMENLKLEAVKRPLGLARIGDFWLERAQWDVAKQAYEEGRDKESGKRAEYICRLAEWRLAQGQKAEARKLVEEAHKQIQGHPLLDAYLAAVRLGEVPTERRVEERKRLESILQRMPDSPFVRYHLGRAYLLERKLQPAADQFERAVRLDANYAAGWLALAEVEMARGNVVTAELRAETVLRRNPGSSRALMIQARAQATRGKLVEASQSLAGVMEREPENHEARFLMAMASARQGKLDEATKQLEMGRKLQPEDLRWPLAQSAVLSKTGKAGEAKEVLEKAIASAGAKPQLLMQLAALQIDLKDGVAAARSFEKLVAQDAKNLEYRLGLAGARALSGDRAGALQQYAELQALKKDDPRVWLQPAALLGEMGRHEEARKSYEEVLRVAPNHPQALNNLAWLLLERHQDERRALELAQRARQAVRQSPEVDGTLAEAYSRLAMHRNATAVYEEMLSYVAESDRQRVERLLAGSRKKQRKEGNS